MRSRIDGGSVWFFVAWLTIGSLAPAACGDAGEPSSTEAWDPTAIFGTAQYAVELEILDVSDSSVLPEDEAFDITVRVRDNVWASDSAWAVGAAVGAPPEVGASTTILAWHDHGLSPGSTRFVFLRDIEIVSGVLAVVTLAFDESWRPVGDGSDDVERAIRALTGGRDDLEARRDEILAVVVEAVEWVGLTRNEDAEVPPLTGRLAIAQAAASTTAP
jgi:hypothetical protein